MSPFVPSLALADDQTVAQGVTDHDGKTVTGTDTLTIEKGGTLDVDGTAITWEGASPAPGVTITNSGTIKATSRGIDTDGDDNPRFITVINNKGAVIETGADSFRVDTDVTDGAIIVENAGLIRALGGQALDFDAVESMDAVISIHNKATGTIQADDSDAINLRGGAISILNEGTISGLSEESRGIDIAEFANITSILITNAEGATIEAFGEAIRIDSDGNDGATGVVVLDNAGLIVSRGISDDPGQAVDFDKIDSTDASITIYNRATGEIRGEADDALRTGEGATVYNWGKIVGKGLPYPDGDPDDDMKADGIDVGEHSATIYNYGGGLISGDRHGITTDIDVTVYNDVGGTIIGHDGSGVGSDGDGTVFNYGRITGAVSDDPININGDGDGVDIDGLGEIINYGIIEGTGAKGIKDGSPNASEGIAMGGGFINNASVDAVISGKDNGILVDDSENGPAPEATIIVNRGTIRGETGFGIMLVGDQADTIINAGLIEGVGGLAIDLGGGDDTLDILTGSRILGDLDGGAGSDTVTLSGFGTFAGGQNLEWLEVGSGFWTLTGEQNYASGILAEGGTFSVDGLLTSAGTYTQEAEATYAVQIGTGGLEGKIVVDGAANLAGSVKVNAIGGIAPGLNHYTILTAGSINGTFSATDTLFLDLELDYDAENVYLDVARTVSFAEVAKTANQKAVANAIDNFGSGELFAAIANLDDADIARAIFASLSGEVHASAQTALIQDSHFIVDAVSNRVRTAFDGVAGSSLPVMAYGEDGLELAPAATERFAAWGQVFGSWGSTDSDGNAAELDRSVGGMLVGADALVGEAWRVGLLAGYSRSSFDVDESASSGDSDNFHLGVYGGTQWGALGLRAGAAYTWNKIETERTVATETLKGDYDAGTTQLFGELGYRLDTAGASFEPFANLSYVSLDSDGFTETGGMAALTADSSTTDTTFTTLGVRASTKFGLGSLGVKANGMVGWRHAFGDIEPVSQVGFDGGDVFSVAGAPIAEDALALEAGLDFELSPQATLGVSYTGQIASDAQDNGIEADLSIRF
jgi:outer membrane autotransporter protein